MDLLDKTYGSTRPKAQLSRNAETFRRLEEGSLQPGDLYALCTGAPAPPPPDQAHNPVTVTGKRTTCLTCKGELEQFGPPLQSQPRRCVVCGKLRRKQHNEQQSRRSGKLSKQQQAAEPEPPQAQAS